MILQVASQSEFAGLGLKPEKGGGASWLCPFSSTATCEKRDMSQWHNGQCVAIMPVLSSEGVCN